MTLKNICRKAACPARRIVLALYGAAALAAAAVGHADETLAVGGSYSAQGCVTPGEVRATSAVSVEYRRDGPQFDAHGYAKRGPRGSDCTADGLTLDVAVERQIPLGVDVPGTYALAKLGYDQHGVTGFDKDNVLVFGAVKAPQAKFGIGATRFGIELEAGYDIAAEAASVAIAADKWGFEFDADWTGGFRTARLSYDFVVGDRFGVRVAARHAYGFDALPDPFGGRADAPASNRDDSVEFALTYKVGN